MENFFSQLLCGIHKSHTTQQAPFEVFHKKQKELHSSGFVGPILMNLSKACDCLPHNVLLAKLEAYDFDNSFEFLNDYLSFRKLRTTVGSSYNSWSEISREIPQVSILSSLLFNIFIKNIFFFIKEPENCNFVDDNTL